MISVRNYFRIITILTLGKLLLPIVFINVPLPFRSLNFYQIVWVISVLIFTPNLLMIKNVKLFFMLPILFWLLTFIFFSFFDREITINPFFLLYYFIPILMYFHFVNSNDIKGLRIAIFAAIFFILISDIISIIYLKSNPLAARELLNISGGEKSFSIRGAGLVDFDYINSLLFITPMLVYSLFIEFKKGNKIKFSFLVVVVLSVLYLIIVSQFTTALLFSFIILILAVLMIFFRIKYIAYIVIILTAIAFNFNFLASLFSEISNYSISPFMAWRFENISIFFETGSMVDIYGGYSGENSRVMRMEDVIDSIVGNYFLGGGISREHNFWLDLLSQLGLFFLIPFFLFFSNQVKVIHNNSLRGSRKFYILSTMGFLLFGAVNNINYPTIWTMFFFIVPAFGYYNYAENNSQI